MRIFTLAANIGIGVYGLANACDTGYIRDPSGDCVDIDECVTDIHNCLSPFTCHNLLGSYGCDFGHTREDLKCGLNGDFATCSGLPWGTSGEVFSCCNQKQGQCGNGAHFCGCEDCVNYESIAITYSNIEDSIFTSTYDDDIFGTLGENRDYILNWAMNHLSTSTWLHEIIRRAMWQTQELTNYFKMSKCRDNEKLKEPVPTSLGAIIAKEQVSGKYAAIFNPVIDHYLSDCSTKKNNILKHKMNKIASLIVKACGQVSVDCPQFGPQAAIEPEELTLDTSFSRARPYGAALHYILGANAAVGPPTKAPIRPYYKKPQRKPYFAVKNLVDDGFQTLYKRMPDGTYLMRRVLGT